MDITDRKQAEQEIKRLAFATRSRARPTGVCC